MTCDLYRFYDADERLLYVGISLHAAARASQHRAEKGWWPDVARMDIERLPTRELALGAERAAIRDEKPRYNVMHAGDNQPPNLRDEAARRWPDAAWIIGYGQYASVAYCNVTTVKLCQTEQAAAFAKRTIDRGACGGHCSRNHEIVRLS